MASRKDEKERRRQERLEAERAREREQMRRRRYAMIAGTVLGVAVIAAVVAVIAAGGGDDSGKTGGAPLDIAAQAPPQQRISDLGQAAKTAGCKLENPAIEGRTHTTKPVKYGTNPPTSGNHNPVPAVDGAYSKDPGVFHLVHSLEHGRVIIWYKPDLRRKRLAQVKGLFEDDTYHMIVTPKKTMPYELAATAWGHLAGCKKVTDETFDVLRAFRDRYRDKAPEFVQ
jgi:hypothetical protein